MAEYQGKRFKRPDERTPREQGPERAGARFAPARHAAPQGGSDAPRSAHAAGTASPGAHARTDAAPAPARPDRSATRSHAARAEGASSVPPARSHADAIVSGVQPYARRARSAGGSGGAVPPRSIARRTASGGDGGPSRRRRLLPLVLIGVGIVLLIAAGGIFISSMLGYQQAVETYDRLEEYAQVSDSDGSGIPVVDFASLQEINPDVVAWIYVPGTNISYPVVQGDDNTTYLNRLFDGTDNSSGSIFLDADATAPGMVDQQTTVYGHHMNNQTMFYQIDDTTSQDAFDAIDSVYYITPDTTYRCRPLMTSVVQDSYVDARRGTFSDALTLVDYLTDLRGYAKAQASDAEERIASATKVLSLITCSSEIPTADRTVMVLTVEEETPTVQATSA